MRVKIIVQLRTWRSSPKLYLIKGSDLKKKKEVNYSSSGFLCVPDLWCIQTVFWQQTIQRFNKPTAVFFEMDCLTHRTAEQRPENWSDVSHSAALSDDSISSILNQLQLLGEKEKKKTLQWPLQFQTCFIFLQIWLRDHSFNSLYNLRMIVVLICHYLNVSIEIQVQLHQDIWLFVVFNVSNSN